MEASGADALELNIYNLPGQKVKTLVNEFQEKGRRTILWNSIDDFGSKVSSGIYLYRIKAGDWTDVKKMILMK